MFLSFFLGQLMNLRILSPHILFTHALTFFHEKKMHCNNFVIYGVSLLLIFQAQPIITAFLASPCLICVARPYFFCEIVNVDSSRQPSRGPRWSFNSLSPMRFLLKNIIKLLYIYIHTYSHTYIKLLLADQKPYF